MIDQILRHQTANNSKLHTKKGPNISNPAIFLTKIITNAQKKIPTTLELNYCQKRARRSKFGLGFLKTDGENDRK